MILDKQNLFSEDQAITATANSTNIIDLGADNALVNTPNLKDAELYVQVTADFATLTSLTVTLTTDNDVAFGSETTLLTSAAIAAASLVAGYKFKFSKLPEGTERYLRLTYTVAGSDATTGTIMAGLVLGSQTSI
jgi:hypothetical protein